MHACTCHGLIRPVHLLLFAILVAFTGAEAALVRPYPGHGNFPLTIDAAYRWQDDGVLDVEVLVAVRSGDLMFVRPTRELPFQADLDVTVRLEGMDGYVKEVIEHVVIRE